VPETSLPFVTRLWFAWACFFRVLFDGAFAARAWNVRGEAAPTPALPPAEAKAPAAAAAPALAPAPAPTPAPTPAPAPEPPSPTAALQLLALLQREGRLVDFLEQDIVPFSDAEIGAAVRVVHEGCRKALRGHAKLAPVMKEDEGATVTVPLGFNPAEVKLSGNVQGSAPYKGTLRHKGWRASDLSLPTPVKGHDATVIAPAEVEL
jgi:hypothetical protein